MTQGFDIEVRSHPSGWWDIEWKRVTDFGEYSIGMPDRGTISAETLQSAWDRLTEMVVGSRKDK